MADTPNNALHYWSNVALDSRKHTNHFSLWQTTYRPIFDVGSCFSFENTFQERVTCRLKRKVDDGVQVKH